MKLLWSLVAALVAVGVFSGCESVRSDIRHGVAEKISGPVFRSREFESDPRATYEAAKASLEQMGLRFERGGAAQGRLEALSSVSSSDSLKGSRQLRLQVRISGDEVRSEVSALFTELLQDDFNKGGAGFATENSLKDTSMYEVLFRNIQQNLDRGRQGSSK